MSQKSSFTQPSRFVSQALTPNMAMPIVLREVGLAAAGRDAHAKPALFIIENEHIALALGAFQT
jgi:hypothetical protein